MTTFINLTPHDITLNNGEVHKKSGAVAGISENIGSFVNGIRQDSLAGIENLPNPKKDTIYIVSMPTLLALRSTGSDRSDVVCPITRGPGVKKHPDKGFIISVPGFRTF